MKPVDAHKIEEILAPGYLTGIEQLPIELVRQRRHDCQEVEGSLSYVRRLVQGRLDIVMAELQRRREGTADGDLHSLVGQLPEILSDRVRAPGNGRLMAHIAPSDPEIDDSVLARIDAVADAERLGRLASSSDEEVQALVEPLSALEQEVSGHRRALHERIDALQRELVRRYKTGEADVESLLR
jgi:hypothetical protein